MKKLLTVLLLFVFLLQHGYAQIPAKPNPPRLVNDFAHVMTPDQVATLESKLVAYDDSTSVQIAVVTVPIVPCPHIGRHPLTSMNRMATSQSGRVGG